MASGYLTRGGKPDTDWWISQIELGKEFRNRVTSQNRWNAWRAYYRGNYKDGCLPVAMYFSMVRSVVPRVYFRNPAISVTPEQPGFLNMAFATVVGRLDNKMFRDMKVKQEMKLITQDSFMFGTGFAKLGYGAQYDPAAKGMDAKAPLDKRDRRVEYDPRITPNQPWLRRLHPGNMIVPDCLASWRDARWTCHWLQRSKDDILDDPRFSANNSLPASALQVSERLATGAGSDRVLRPIEMVDLYEVHDRKTGEVFVIAPLASKDHRLLYQGQDTVSRMGHPFFPVQFNPDDEFFWAVPDSRHLEFQQKELNEINTQMMHHRRIAIAKIMAQRGAITEAEATKIVSEDVAAVVWTEGDPREIQKFEAGSPEVLSILMQNRENVYTNVRETIGFSRNQMGDFQSRRGDTSAAEALIVDKGSEIRVDERRDSLADMVVDVAEAMNSTMFEHWNAEKVVEVIGPGGARIWVQFEPDLLKAGKYNIKVDPDTMQPTERQSREQKAAQLYQLVKDNPLIDPVNLTRFLLNEIEGVEMDDLMRALPPPQDGQGSSPGKALPMGQFADLLQKQVGSAQRNPEQIPARASKPEGGQQSEGGQRAAV